MNQDEANANPEGADQELDSGKVSQLNGRDSNHPQLNSVSLTSMLEGMDLEKLDQQAPSCTDQENTRVWTVVSDYFATGEGRHVHYLRSSADSAAEAREAFRSRFFKHADDQHWAWILIGLEVHRGVFWPEYLTGFRIPPDELEMHWRG